MNNVLEIANIHTTMYTIKGSEHNVKIITLYQKGYTQKDSGASETYLRK
jgi:hypothetical protein